MIPGEGAVYLIICRLGRLCFVLITHPMRLVPYSHNKEKEIPKPNAIPPYTTMQCNNQNGLNRFFLYRKKKEADLKTAVLDSDLASSSSNTAQCNGLATGQSIHGVERNVEARSGVVNGQDVDGVAAVRQLPAGSTASRVPAGNGGDTSDVWEARDLALGRPVVFGLEAVGAVRAGDDVERAGAVVVAGIIRDYRI